MPHHARVVREQNELKVLGDLDFHNVMVVVEQGSQFIVNQQQSVFNFSELKTSNSAGLALIIEWIKISHQLKRRVQFTGISQKLMAIAQAAGLERLISRYRASQGHDN